MPTIRLRAIELADLDLLYCVENDESLWCHGTTTTPFSRYSLEQYILTNLNDFYADRQLRLVAETEHGVVGLIDLFDYSPHHQRAEVGIVVLSAFRGKGYGVALLQEMLRYVSSHLHLHQLYATVCVDNQPAMRSFLHAGFVPSAVLRDWIFLSGGRFADAQIFQIVL